MFDFDPHAFRLEDLERIGEESQALVDRMSELFDQMSAITGYGTAADGQVTASVDNGGRVTEISFKPRALRLGSHALGEAATAAVQEAQDNARVTAEQALAAVIGTVSLDRDEIRKQVEEIQESFTRAMNEQASRIHDR